MKNWKTTAVAVIAALGVAGDTLLPYLQGEGDVNWIQVIIALAIAVFGTLTKDHDKGGDEKVTQ